MFAVQQTRLLAVCLAIVKVVQLQAFDQAWALSGLASNDAQVMHAM